MWKLKAKKIGFWSCSLNWITSSCRFYSWWIWEAAVGFVEKLSFDVSSYINWLFIWFSSLLCCFEFLMYWWRNRWVESYWYKIFLCLNDVCGCFENCFSLNLLFNVLTVSALSKICYFVEFWKVDFFWCVFI